MHYGDHVASGALEPIFPTRHYYVPAVLRSAMMRAIILAAGRGSRMGQLCDERPKCLVEFANKSLLERQVAALRAGGAEAVAVVRGYRADMIELPDLAYFHNERWAETNMVMSLVAAAEWLKSGPVIVSYSDIFYRGELVRELANTAGDLVIAYDRIWRSLWSNRFADPLADAETFQVDSSGKLIEIGNKTSRIDEIQGQYMGLLKFTPRAWADVEMLLDSLDARACDRLDMTGLLQRLLTRNIAIGTLGTNGQWGEIDNPGDLALYESMLREGRLTLDG
jgi:L-glutamine-phosphate cytidylyltransferase